MASMMTLEDILFSNNVDDNSVSALVDTLENHLNSRSNSPSVEVPKPIHTSPLIVKQELKIPNYASSVNNISTVPITNVPHHLNNRAPRASDITVRTPTCVRNESLARTDSNFINGPTPVQIRTDYKNVSMPVNTNSKSVVQVLGQPVSRQPNEINAPLSTVILPVNNSNLPAQQQLISLPHLPQNIPRTIVPRYNIVPRNIAMNTVSCSVAPQGNIVNHRPGSGAMVNALRQVHPSVLPQRLAVSVAATTSAGNPVLNSASAMSNVNLDNVVKCKNFLSTLIRLASNQSQDTARNVKDLVQSLIDGNLQPEEFTRQLQVELNSNTNQPNLIPFLKKSLPLLRQSLQGRLHTLHQQHQQVRPVLVQQPRLTQELLVKPPMMYGDIHRLNQPRVNIAPPFVKVGGSPLLAPPKDAKKAISKASTTSRDGFIKIEGGEMDDVNDVTSMAGVSISEESAKILQTGEQCSEEVTRFVSHALQLHLKNFVEQLSVMVEHRARAFKVDALYETSSGVRTQLRIFDKMDAAEKRRKEEAEREKLLRAAKSRSKQEDPEHLRLKQRAKEMQQQEMDQIRRKEANLTALAAIGPRKRKYEAWPSLKTNPDTPPAKQPNRTRAKRVTHDDAISLLQNDKHYAKSEFLYKQLQK